MMKVKKIVKRCLPQTHIAIFDEFGGFKDFNYKAEIPASIQEMKVIQVSVEQFDYRYMPSLVIVVKGIIKG